MNDDPQPLHAAVFFHDTSAHWSRGLLRPGFRHVEVAVEATPDLWLSAIGKAGGLLGLVAIDKFDPVAFANATGSVLLNLPVWWPRQRRSPIGIMNCVGIAKAVLGIRAPLVITPWQLYHTLLKEC